MSHCSTRDDRLGNQIIWVGTGARSKFLHATVVNFCHIEIAFLVDADACTPHSAPGKLPSTTGTRTLRMCISTNKGLRSSINAL